MLKKLILVLVLFFSLHPSVGFCAELVEWGGFFKVVSAVPANFSTRMVEVKKKRTLLFHHVKSESQRVTEATFSGYFVRLMTGGGSILRVRTTTKRKVGDIVSPLDSDIFDIVEE